MPHDFEAFGFANDCSTFPGAPVCLLPLPHRDPRTPALKCQPDGTRPSWPQALLRFPLKISPKQGLASRCAPLTERHGWHGVSPKMKEQDNGLRQKQREESAAT
jgi:hypothetical protein